MEETAELKEASYVEEAGELNILVQRTAASGANSEAPAVYARFRQIVGLPPTH